MASDHRGQPLDAGKRTVQDSTRIPVITGIDEVSGMHSEFEYEHGRRMTRQEHNEMFTPPDGGGPVVPYPYPRIKTRVTPSTAINPPPKRRNVVW